MYINKWQANLPLVTLFEYQENNTTTLRCMQREEAVKYDTLFIKAPLKHSHIHTRTRTHTHSHAHTLTIHAGQNKNKTKRPKTKTPTTSAQNHNRDHYQLHAQQDTTRGPSDRQ